MMKLKYLIEILWAVLGGLFFSMLPRFFASGRPDAGRFDLSAWFKGDLFGPRHGIDEFLFGFLVTLIIVWSVKLYSSLDRQSQTEAEKSYLRGNLGAIIVAVIILIITVVSIMNN